MVLLGAPGGLLGRLGRSRVSFSDASRGLLEPIGWCWGHVGVILGPSSAIFGGLGNLLGRSWTILEASCGDVGTMLKSRHYFGGLKRGINMFPS